jgi:hypothetical protein
MPVCRLACSAFPGKKIKAFEYIGMDIGIPKSTPTIKKPSRWERTKAAIYKSPSLLAKTLSILQRTLSSPTPSEADSPKVLTENPLVELPTSLYPSLIDRPFLLFLLGQKIV